MSEETITHEVTAEEIADNNLGEALEPGDTIEIPVVEESSVEDSVETPVVDAEVVEEKKEE
jgi:hypothetical protein